MQTSILFVLVSCGAVFGSQTQPLRNMHTPEPQRSMKTVFQDINFELDRNDSDCWHKVNMNPCFALSKLKISIEKKLVPEGTEDSVQEFFELVESALLGLGGAIPRIVDNRFGEDWQKQLIDDGSKTLSKDELCEVLQILEGFQIFFVDWESFPVLDGFNFWTLPNKDFEAGQNQPNFENAKLFISIRDLPKMYSRMGRWRVGRVRVTIHELVHAIRLMKRLREHSTSLDWCLMKNGWAVDMDSFVEKLATPQKLCEHKFGHKVGVPNYAESGRLWEHSISGGRAILQRDLDLCVFQAMEEGCLKPVEINFPEELAVKVMKKPQKLREYVCNIAKKFANESELPVALFTSASGLVNYLPLSCGSLVISDLIPKMVKRWSSRHTRHESESN